MKRSSLLSRPTKTAGFTLVELLVVIGIIAILASVLFSAGTAAIRTANRAKAANLANQIQAAVANYYGEYGVYPVATQTVPTDVVIGDTSATDGASWATLDCVLCGNIHPSNPTTTFTAPTAGPTNTRSIAFLNIKGGDVFPTTSTTGVTDAPKNPLPSSATANIYFNIAMNSSYTGVLGTTAPTITAMPNFTSSSTGTIVYGGTSTAGVAVWANCNGSSSGTANPNFYVHTY